MQEKHLKLATVSAMLLASSSSLALPFSGFDPRSMAMGGAGVAVGNASTAPIFNPALLSAIDAKERFAIALPMGARIGDQDNLMSAIDAFQKGNYSNNLDIATTTYNSTQTGPNLSDVGNKIQILSDQLATLGGKALTVDGGGALVIGVPKKHWGFAFYADAAVAAGASMTYKDSQLFTDFNTATQTVAACLTTPTVTCQNDIQADSLVQRFYPSATGTSGNTSSTFDTSTEMQSTFGYRGATLTEVGISVSNEFELANHSFSVGLTPKMVGAQLIDYSESINTSTTSTPSGDNYIAKYNMFNVDVGLAKSYNNGWRAGFVVKNLIPYSLEFKNFGVATGNKLELNPQARVGGSYQGKWGTVALDVDLSKNKPAGLEKESQFVAIGSEFDLFKVVQLRAGYRADIGNTDNSVASIGAGLNVLGMNADLAVAGNDKQVGASFQLGLHF
ncbi:MAG: conjugal transfer protein TraF [Gallionellaceae bacterium]|jgi:hypothetical protein